jgi:hypothetical protein
MVRPTITATLAPQEKIGFSSISALAQRTQTVRGGFGSVATPIKPVQPVQSTQTTQAQPVQQMSAQMSATVPKAHTPAAQAPKMSIKPGVMVVGAKTCPTDPAELAQCDSCQ